MKKEDGRLRGMDGLRGVAIIAITLFHMFPSVFRGGYLGVVLFFVLTGFLLVVSAKKKMNQKEFSLRDYYLARIKRIYHHYLRWYLLHWESILFWLRTHCIT